MLVSKRNSCFGCKINFLKTYARTEASSHKWRSFTFRDSPNLQVVKTKHTSQLSKHLHELFFSHRKELARRKKDKKLIQHRPNVFAFWQPRTQQPTFFRGIVELPFPPTNPAHRFQIQSFKQVVKKEIRLFRAHSPKR